jgi:hypothetical protein
MMRHIHNALIAATVIGAGALIASAADAQYAPGYGYGYGPYGHGGRYYSYGADRPNPSLAPNGWDQDSPRDFQMQGK